MPLPSFLVRLLFGEPVAVPAPEPLVAIAEPEPPPRPPLDARAELRAWLAADAAVAGLYRSLSVSPWLEESCGLGLERAKALLRVEIPDPEAFFEALERLARAEERPADAAFEAAWALRGADPLLAQVSALGRDLPAVLARLEVRPADELLPFLEEIPARRGGEVVWRLPRELALLRRRPARLEDFLAELTELAAAIGRASLERPAELREALLESLARVERDAADPAVYLPSSLRAFEEKLAEWLAAPGAEARERRRSLDAFLLELLEVRYALAAPRPLADGAPLVRARALAAAALKNKALQAPPVLAALLHLLLLAELAARPPGPSPVSSTLEAIAAELEGGYFDAAETARRLRSLESHDCWVFSPIFGLLRLAAPGTAPI